MNYYDVFPLFVPADQLCEIQIKPRFDHAKFPSAEYLKVSNNPVDGLDFHPESGEFLWENAENTVHSWQLTEDGVLRVQAVFPGEQEHHIRVECKNPKDLNSPGKMQGFRVYSLKPDLYSLRPLKGDLHIHTNYSDGRECPSYVAARYREEGFDFITITDHGRYEPSLEAINFWEPLRLEFKIYPGEEVHATDNPVHIVNFGGKFSVNKKCKENESAYRQEVQNYLEKIPRQTSGLDYFPVASSEWVFDQIRAAGGLAIFCHPYWYMVRNVINEGLISEIFQRRRFDALELVGGFYRYHARSNNYQLLRWSEERAKGNHFPVVGSSDSHGTDYFLLSKNPIENILGSSYTESRNADLFGWYYTVVLAKENSVEAIIDAVKQGHCAAVDAPSGERANVYGDFRIGKYVNFLLREYFPVHRIFCQQEGSLMLAHLAGEKSIDEILRQLSGRCHQFREACFRPSTL